LDPVQDKIKGPIQKSIAFPKFHECPSFDVGQVYFDGLVFSQQGFHAAMKL